MNPYDPVEGFPGPAQMMPGEIFFAAEPAPFEEFQREMMRLIASCFPRLRTVESGGAPE